MILVDGKKVAEGKIDATQANVFSADEGADVGLDEGTAVSSTYSVPFKFTGKIHKVTVEVQPTKLGAADAEGLEKAKLARRAGE